MHATADMMKEFKSFFLLNLQCCLLSAESESWSGAEIQAFHEGLNEFDKDFFNVSKKVNPGLECSGMYYCCTLHLLQ